MKYKKDYYGYVYEWINSTNNIKYIGSHYGAVDDYYKGSGKDFMVAYKNNPQHFTMRVLEYVSENNKKLVLETEKKWLDTVVNIKDDPTYYNLNNDAAGGFGYLDESHIIKRAETLKKKHAIHGLSIEEIQSYKQKIQTRLDRIATTGFTDKEKEQYAKYGIKLQVTLPSGEIRIYNSLSAAERDLKLNIKYGLKICAKKLDFKGYILVKLNEPLIDCRKK